MTIQASLLEQLKKVEPIGLENQLQQLKSLFDDTVSNGQGNSLLLTGPSGTGKSLLIEYVMEDYEDSITPVYLNGLFQTNDRQVMSSIFRQLQLISNESLSFAEQFQILITTLQNGSNSNKPIVFILDHLDLFCQFPKQLLLYNLFDLSQNQSVPILVIGLTCRMDTLLLFEKRIKSRFSHRMIDFYPIPNFEQFLDLLDTYITVHSCSQSELKFNDLVRDLLKLPECLDLLQDWFDVHNDFHSLLTLSRMIISKIKSNEPQLVFEDIQSVFEETLIQDFQTKSTQTFSLLESCLLISISKLLQLQILEFNFEMVYDELLQYLKYLSSKNSILARRLVFAKKIVLSNFQGLIDMGVIFYCGSLNCPKEYRNCRLIMTRTQLMESIEDMPELSSELKKWATTR